MATMGFWKSSVFMPVARAQGTRTGHAPPLRGGTAAKMIA